LSALVIPTPGGDYVRLDQAAAIKDAWADRSSMAFHDGRPTVAVQIKRANGFSDLAVAAGVRYCLNGLQADHPEVHLEEVNNMVDPVAADYNSSMKMLYEGALIAVLVVWLFLRDWRATALAAVALPLSLIPTFSAMALCGFTLNTVTLLALSLVVGILVDDAIVEIENISRRSGRGLTPAQTALEAANEIGLAVIAASFTLAAVFLPTAFMGGVHGLVFRQFGITASVAVLASLLVARLLTPMMAAVWMKAESGPTKESFFLNRYLSVVKVCLKNPGKTMAATLLIFAASLALIPLIGKSFMPPADVSQSKAALTLAPGTDIEKTSRVALYAAGLLGGMDGVSSVFTAVGAGGGGGKGAPSASGDAASAVLTVSLRPLSERARKQSEIEAEIRKRLSQVAGAKVEVGDGEGNKLDITLAGDDSGLLEKTASRLENELRGLAKLGAVASSAARQAPEIQVVPDFNQAAALGVSSQAMAEVVRVATSGAYSAELPKLNLPERQAPIKVRFDPLIRSDLDELAQLKAPGRNGLVPLGSVAELKIGDSPAQINRIDREKNIAISVELNGLSLGQAVELAQALPTLKNLPPGIALVNQGETRRMNDLWRSLGTAMLIGVFCVYGVLVLLFKDFKQPITILAAMPLALGGALIPLIVAGHSFSMAAAIGILMLMGIVAKNSILLVEYAIRLRGQGLERFEALMEACRKRSRPIVMTSLAMAGGMMPVILGLSGGDPSFRRPMGIVVVGGLMTSTVLSLAIIPVIYTLMDNLKSGSSG
jgi:multidrug efflux pump subunit AcrB